MPAQALKHSETSLGCDLGGATRETRKHFSSAKRKYLETRGKKIIVVSGEGKIYLNILAVPGEFWLLPKQRGGEGRALWRDRVGGTQMR